MTKFLGKTALVTAAAAGIGRAAAVALAEAGARVIATDINEVTLQQIDHPRINTRRLDVLDPGAVARLASCINGVDILFNCAGIVHSGTIESCTEIDLNLAYDLNVMSMVRTIKAVLPGMLDKRSGAIINMASVASSVKGVPNRFAYSVTKAAVIGLTRSVATDYVSQGIRCNAICPGTVDTPSLQSRLRAQGNYEVASAAFIARQPIGRLGTSAEIAELVVYLAGATYTTGQIHVIDGGWTA